MPTTSYTVTVGVQPDVLATRLEAAGIPAGAIRTGGQASRTSAGATLTMTWRYLLLMHPVVVGVVLHGLGDEDELHAMGPSIVEAVGLEPNTASSYTDLYTDPTELVDAWRSGVTRGPLLVAHAAPGDDVDEAAWTLASATPRWVRPWTPRVVVPASGPAARHTVLGGRHFEHVPAWEAGQAFALGEIAQETGWEPYRYAATPLAAPDTAELTSGLHAAAVIGPDGASHRRTVEHLNRVPLDTWPGALNV